MKLLLACTLAALLGLAVVYLGCSPLKRGLAGPNHNMLVSNGRPALAVEAIGNMRLLDSGRCNLAPRLISTATINGNALLWFARYTAGTATLILALAEGEGEYVWDFGNSAPYMFFRERERMYKGQTLYEGSYVIDAAHDPFTLAQGPTLVRRSKLLRSLRKVQVIVEYREPRPERSAGQTEPLENPDFLFAFEERARNAFAILFPEQGEQIPTEIINLDTADKGISRGRLNKWVGDMRRERNE